jgi:hypothetical protein
VEPILAAFPAQFIFACNPREGLTGEVANQVIHHFGGHGLSSSCSKTSKNGQNRAKRVP